MTNRLMRLTCKQIYVLICIENGKKDNDYVDDALKLVQEGCLNVDYSLTELGKNIVVDFSQSEDNHYWEVYDAI